LKAGENIMAGLSGRASVLSLALVLAMLGRASGQTGQELEYNRDIRPILSDNCFACHGPDKASRKAGWCLDRSEDVVDAGAIA
jgi:hypothetical protein